MENVVVTINRQYGSGGKTIGMMLADQMGVKYYNREIVKLASEESGIDEAMFAKVDEKMANYSFFKTKKIYTGDLKTPGSDDFTSDDNLFNIQAKVLKQLARNESCVIIGRCANFILKDMPNVVSVFVHADPAFCREQALARVSIPEKEIDKFIEKTDKFRADYYKYHTGKQWLDLRGYDLCLNSGRLGFDKCVEEILAYIRVRFDKDK